MHAKVFLFPSMAGILFVLAYFKVTGQKLGCKVAEEPLNLFEIHDIICVYVHI